MDEKPKGVFIPRKVIRALLITLLFAATFVAGSFIGAQNEWFRTPQQDARSQAREVEATAWKIKEAAQRAFEKKDWAFAAHGYALAAFLHRHGAYRMLQGYDPPTPWSLAEPGLARASRCYYNAASAAFNAGDYDLSQLYFSSVTQRGETKDKDLIDKAEKMRKKAILLRGLRPPRSERNLERLEW